MSTRYGDGTDFEAIPDTAIDGTAPIVTKVVDMRDMDCVSFDLIVEFAEEAIPVEEGDDAVAADDELNFAGFDFTGLEDAIIRISGSTDNDGDHIITTGSDGTAVCAGSTLTNETFDPAEVTAILLHADDPPTGAWTFESSNNYTVQGIASYGQVPGQGDWVPCTELFDPTSVTTAVSEHVQANLRARAVRGTFTPTDGVGTVRAHVNAKSWS